MDKYKQIVNKNLEKYINIKSSKLHESALYSLKSPGKRLRPTLLLSSYEAMGGSKNNPLPFACAVEMIHAYSLVHDDLPAMDNDNLRRGKPTNHVIFGEDIAILTGDILLNQAYETMTKYCRNNLNKKNLLAMEIISRASGNMVSGQTFDILADIEQIKPEQLFLIHKNKTAKLIQASILAGAVLATTNKKKLNYLAKAGMYMGLAFQIKDDYLDATQTEKESGKTNSDFRNKKSTYVSLFGLDKSLKDSNICKQKAIKILNDINLKTKDLQTIAQKI